MDTHTADLLSEEAKRALVARKDSIARELADRVLRSHPAHGQSLQVHATLALRADKPEEALDAASRALLVLPSDPGAMNIAASALRMLNRLDEAEGLLREALRVAPQLPETHLNLALTLLDAGSQAKAETYFRNVIALRQDSERAYYYLGRIALENSQFEESVKFFRSALAISPGNADARSCLIEALLAFGLTEAALDEVERGLQTGASNRSIRVLAERLHFELAHAEPAPLEPAGDEPQREDSGERAVPCKGKLGLIDLWCERNGSQYFRAARAQWLSFGRPTIYPGEDEPAFECPRPFSKELFIASIPDARILPVDLLLLTRDDEILAEGVLNNVQTRLHANHHIRAIADDGRVLLKIPGRYLDVQGAVCYLGAADNYFGWVYECLGRLWIINQRPELSELPLLVSDGLTSRQLDLLSLLGVSERRLLKAPHDAVARCDMIHVPANPVAGWFVAPMAVEYLRRSLRPSIDPGKAGRRRLFISSHASEDGKIANEGEVWALLKKVGFERIVPSEITTAELCSCFAGAEVVVGAASDAMAFLFLLPAGASVCVFLPRGALSPKLFCASATLSVNFSYIVCEPDFLSNDRLDRCDIFVSTGLVVNFLSDLKVKADQSRP